MSAGKLPAEVVWEQSGHLTEEALAAFADGEEALLPADATAHGHACEECARRMGEAAMLSLSVATVLREVNAADLRVSAAPASQRVAPPFWAIASGLAFAALGAVPFLLGIPAWLLHATLVLQRSMPVLAHSALSLSAGSGGAASGRMLVTLASLAVLMMSTYAVSRLAPREGILR
jgi:hypothetical protein